MASTHDSFPKTSKGHGTRQSFGRTMTTIVIPLLLYRRGVRCVAIEPDSDISDKPSANVCSPQVMYQPTVPAL